MFSEEKTNILIIDDDEHILEMLTVLLSKEGYVTDTAKTGAEAIEKSEAKGFNLALIDIVLPDMLGTQLLVKLRDTIPKMRKIIITGHANLDNAVEALNLGADAYIMKPVKSRDLLKVVKEQLRKQQDEKTMTLDRIIEYMEARKVDFVEVVKQSLNSFLGESATSATIYHLGGKEALRDPKVCEERLKAVFSGGAEIILKHILKSLEAASGKKSTTQQRKPSSKGKPP